MDHQHLLNLCLISRKKFSPTSNHSSSQQPSPPQSTTISQLISSFSKKQCSYSPKYQKQNSHIFISQHHIMNTKHIHFRINRRMSIIMRIIIIIMIMILVKYRLILKCSIKCLQVLLWRDAWGCWRMMLRECGRCWGGLMVLCRGEWGIMGGLVGLSGEYCWRCMRVWGTQFVT